jgi:hypothetical protein
MRRESNSLSPRISICLRPTRRHLPERAQWVDECKKPLDLQREFIISAAVAVAVQ